MKKNAFIFLLAFYSANVYAETWSVEDRTRLQSFSLKALKSVQDPSNKYLNDQNAANFGKMLFNDKRLSSNKKLACSSCHIKEKAFTDGKKIAFGLREGFRNTPTLLDVAQHDWFFADGAKDSLWAQVLSSMENPAEQNFSRIEMIHLVASDESYRKLYQQIFENPLPVSEELKLFPKKAGPNAALKELVAWKKMSKQQRNATNQFFTNIGKALAAYVATIKSAPTRFDEFVEELKNKPESNKLTASEQRGLRLFLSPKSSCSNCHSGPLFSNKAFHNIATGILGKDNGRAEVIENVLRDEFNCTSQYSDAKPEQCMELNFVNRNKHQLSGAFKTPFLRNVRNTAPYMHDGRFESLNDVLQHYISASKIKPKHTDLSSITLEKAQQTDIINFLKTL